MNILILEKYKQYLGYRHSTLSYVFNKLSNKKNNIIVELGTSRSFVNGNLPGSMSNDLKYWNENIIENWDWGAGIFTRVCAELISGTGNILHTVDPLEKAINISKTITSKMNSNVNFHQTTSTEFLNSFKGKIDLLYMDHNETSEEGALLHLKDSELLIGLDIISDDSIILIDDINTNNPVYFDYGKGKYSIPYLQKKGFKVTMESYQIVMERYYKDLR